MIWPISGTGSGWAKRIWCKVWAGWIDIPGWQQPVGHLWIYQDWFYGRRHEVWIFNQFSQAHRWWRLQQQRGLQFQRLRLIFSFYFHTYPRAVFCTGVFFCPLKLNFHYKSHFTQPSSRKTDSEFKIQNSKLSADSFPPFLDRLLERSYPFMQLQITNLS